MLRMACVLLGLGWFGGMLFSLNASDHPLPEPPVHEAHASEAPPKAPAIHVESVGKKPLVAAPEESAEHTLPTKPKTSKVSPKAKESAHASGPHWGYEGTTAPELWGSLSPSYQLCQTGRHQSPVDIQDAADSDLAPIEFVYQPSPIQLINNGHTIQFNAIPGSYILLHRMRYDLVQFHFHSPSENTKGGQHYDMELHLVHKNAKGQLAVVGVFMKRGKLHSSLQTLWEVLPRLHDQTITSNLKFNPAELLPQTFSYYTFPGSLTTPPCTEGVTWLVLREPIQVNDAQVERFVAIIGVNSRPVQPLYTRTILFNAQ